MICKRCAWLADHNLPGAWHAKGYGIKDLKEAGTTCKGCDCQHKNPGTNIKTAKSPQTSS